MHLCRFCRFRRFLANIFISPEYRFINMSLILSYFLPIFTCFADFCRFSDIWRRMLIQADFSNFSCNDKRQVFEAFFYILRIFVDFANFADCLPLLPLSPVYKYSNNSFQFCQFLTIIAQFCRFWRVLPILINFVFYHQYFQKIHHN